MPACDRHGPGNPLALHNGFHMVGDLLPLAGKTVGMKCRGVLNPHPQPGRVAVVDQMKVKNFWIDLLAVGICHCVSATLGRLVAEHGGDGKRISLTNQHRCDKMNQGKRAGQPQFQPASNYRRCRRQRTHPVRGSIGWCGFRFSGCGGQNIAGALIFQGRIQFATKPDSGAFGDSQKRSGRLFYAFDQKRGECLFFNRFIIFHRRPDSDSAICFLK